MEEHGFAPESLEAIRLALGRSLPEKVLDRRRVFQRLRQLRLIDYYSDEDLEQTEASLRIHSMIVDLGAPRRSRRRAPAGRTRCLERTRGVWLRAAPMSP